MEADLVIGADGANSLVRKTHEAQFGTEILLLENRFAWFGAKRPFDYLTQTFKQLPQGSFNAHHYLREHQRAVAPVHAQWHGPEPVQSA